MQLDTRALGVLVSSYCCSTYRVANLFSSLGAFSSFSIGGPCVPSYRWLWASTSVFSRHWHSLIRDSYNRVPSAKSFWNSVWVWWLFIRWIPGLGSLWIVHPFVLAPNFVSVTPFMGILFPILRKNEVSTHWSSLFLIFLCFTSCILGILSF